MSVRDGAIKLKASLKKLQQRFEETEAEWSDQARERFETEYIAALCDNVVQALQGIDRLAEVAEQAQRECS